MDGFSGRRIAAARELAGFKNRAQLASKINLAGFSAATIGSWERGEDTPERHHLREIAEACVLPLEFFCVENFDALRGDRIAELEAEVSRLQRLRQEVLAAVQEAVAQEMGQGLRSNILPSNAESAPKATGAEDA